MTGAWREVRLGDLGNIITGRTPPSSRPECFGDKYPFVTPSDMDGRKRASTTQRYLSDTGADLLRRNLLPRGSVAVSCIGWQMGKVIMTSRPSFSNQQLNTIIPHDGVDADFLYYSLVPWREYLLSLGSATGVRTPILNKSAFSDLRLLMPPVDIRRKITSILSAYDDLIENNLRRIAILEEMAQLIYHEWFVRFRFPSDGQVHVAASPLGEIPDGWEVVNVGDIVKRVPAGKLYDKRTVSESGTVPVLDQGRSGIIGYHGDEPAIKASETAPVVVFANHTCYQRLVLFPFSAIQNVLPFLPHPERARDIYWLHWATKDLVEFNDYKGHWPEFMNKRLPLPPMGVCSAFGQAVKPMVQQVYRLERKNANLCRTRDLLLPKLISGDLNLSEMTIETDGLAE